VYVSGGRNALLGSDEELHKTDKLEAVFDAAGDVSMAEVPADEEQSNKRVTLEEVRAQEKGFDPPPDLYTSVVCRFLTGFLGNAPTSVAFIDGGGLEYALDLATVPTLDTIFNNSTRGLDEELSGMLRLLIDQKPHLAIPAIIHRLHRALDILEPLLSSTSERAFFSSFTQVPEPNSTDVLHGSGPAALEDGTSYAKALIIVDQLCTALSVAFQTQHYNHRTTTTMFTQANLTDMYVGLVEKLGKLHRSCVWEDI
jgi:E3 ubiquitin-protein ligase HUWE1